MCVGGERNVAEKEKREKESLPHHKGHGRLSLGTEGREDVT